MTNHTDFCRSYAMPGECVCSSPDRAAIYLAEHGYNAEDRITTWCGKSIGDMTRGELIDALDWCCKRMRANYQEQAKRGVRK